LIFLVQEVGGRNGIDVIHRSNKFDDKNVIMKMNGVNSHHGKKLFFHQQERIPKNISSY
jgi:hypothetical protein